MGKISVRAKMEELGLQMQGLVPAVADRLVATVAKLSEMTYNRALEMTRDRLHSTRSQYIDALKLVQEGEGVFVVYLEEHAEHLEEGYPPFPMLPKLVQGPKSKVGKDGKRYVVVPIRKEMNDPVTKAAPGGGDMVTAIKSVIDQRKFRMVRGEVSKETGKFTTVERYTGDVPSPHLKGLTRVREYKGAEKEGRPMSSAYFIFRVASENQDPSKSWRHRGFKGANIFPDLERWADNQLGQIIREFFE